MPKMVAIPGGKSTGATWPVAARQLSAYTPAANPALPRPAVITDQQKEEFAGQGYLIVRGMLDVAADIRPFIRAYVGSLDALHARWHAATQSERPA
jgi:hypothetical protein